MRHHWLVRSKSRCGCQLERIGEDVSEKLDYIPGTFQVERPRASSDPLERWAWAAGAWRGDLRKPESPALDENPGGFVPVWQPPGRVGAFSLR